MSFCQCKTGNCYLKRSTCSDHVLGILLGITGLSERERKGAYFLDAEGTFYRGTLQTTLFMNVEHSLYKPTFCCICVIMRFQSFHCFFYLHYFLGFKIRIFILYCNKLDIRRPVYTTKTNISTDVGCPDAALHFRWLVWRSSQNSCYDSLSLCGWSNLPDPERTVRVANLLAYEHHIVAPLTFQY